MTTKYEHGFIALISSVIISVILMSLALTAGASSAYSRVNALNAEYKRISLALAESCGNIALLKISQNYNYSPGAGDVVSLGNDGQGRPETCTIKSISFPSGKTGVQNTAVITTEAEYPPKNGSLSTGAFSNITISGTVQNPSYAVPARGSVMVQVHVVNDDGGVKAAGDFSITVPVGGNPAPSTFAGTETGTLVYVDPGSYNISGSNDAGYAKSISSGCSGSISAGQNASCTITYDDIPFSASLTATVVVKNDNGGTAQPSDFSLTIDGTATNPGVPMVGLAPNVTHTVVVNSAPGGYTPSSWGTDCNSNGTITLFAGQKKTCTIVYDDPAPPAPICVDTVMMLDRTGSMGGQDLTDEKNAANNLLNLYAALTPLPKSAVGVFGAVGASEPYNANIRQTLTTAYSSLINAVNTGLATSNGYTNLASAINVAQSEFTTNGTPGKGHVLILISDGGTNRPSGTVPGDTGFKVPTVSSQNGTGDVWATPEGVYGVGYATDAAGHRERYSALGLSVPSNATVTNVEVKMNGWSTIQSLPATIFTDSFGTGFTDSTFDEAPAWTEGGNGAEKRAAGSGNDSASADGGRFATIFNGGWMCEQINASNATSLQLGYYWRGDSHANSSSDVGVVEYHTSSGGGNCNSASGWNTLQNHDLRNDTSWSTQSSFSLPSSLNNSTFYLRFRANSNTNEYFRVDAVKVTGNQSTTCTVGADLSWNGGSSWSSEDTQTLTNTATDYTLSGGWGSHAWVPNDFSDANFRVRLHDTNPGPTCIIDSLSARVSYTTVSDPYELALNAADAAKIAGTQIFTIHYGSNGTGNRDINFLANIANGLTAISGHQNGSANDLSDTASSGTAGFNSPSAAVSPSQFTNATRAFLSDNSYATDSTNGHQQGYGNFSLSIPPNSSIAGIELNVEAKSSDQNGCQVGAELSTDGGTTFTSTGTTASLGSSDTTYTLGGTANTWGRSWVSGDFSDGKFVVRLRNIDPGNNCTNGSTLSVDRVQVRVSYTGGVPENGDDDNFYVSPTSADMQGIFQAIGEKVCPALTAPPPPPPPSHGNLIVISHVINDNGGTAQPADFQYSVSGLNAVPNSFPASGVDFPGDNIQLDPGAFTVSGDTMGLLYSASTSGCSGTMNAGDVLTCTITYDDLTPPAGSTGVILPPSNVIIGSWQETP